MLRIFQITWNSLVLCEGLFDANAASLASGLPATALLQSIILDGHIKILKKKRPKSITVLLDSDAEDKSMIVACRLVDNGFTVRLCRWPHDLQMEKNDPDSVDSSIIKKMVNEAETVKNAEALTLFRLSSRFPC